MADVQLLSGVGRDRLSVEREDSKTSSYSDCPEVKTFPSPASCNCSYRSGGLAKLQPCKSDTLEQKRNPTLRAVLQRPRKTSTGTLCATKRFAKIHTQWSRNPRTKPGKPDLKLTNRNQTLPPNLVAHNSRSSFLQKKRQHLLFFLGGHFATHTKLGSSSF